MGSSGDRTFAGLLEDIVANVQSIIRSEVRLARAEIREETVKAGKAAGIAGSGAVLAFYAVGFLLLTGVFALETAVQPWLAALIVAVFVGAIAGVLVNIGLKRMKQVNPRPEKTIHSVKENVEWLKNQAR